MMKVAFVDLVNDFYDRHGVYSLSAVLKKNGIEVEFIAERNHARALKRISRVKPGFLLYSSFSSTLPLYRGFDRKVKEVFSVRSVIGGPGPTFEKECVEGSTIDAACTGEGEMALTELILGGFKKGEKNIFLRDDGWKVGFYPFADLDSLPFPDRDPVYSADKVLKNMPSRQFVSGRGCPYGCSYCFNHEYNRMFRGAGAVVRKKSVGYLLDEIRILGAKYPFSNAVFNDDTFIIDRKWFFEFCRRFPVETGLTYTCNIRANLVDEEIVKALKDSGCIGVNWSIESGNDHIRNDVLKRDMSRDDISRASFLLRKYKIPFRIGNIIGSPGESLEQMMETVALNIEASPDLGLANIFVPFPGLQLTDYAVKNGYYRPEVMKALPRDFFSSSALDAAEEQKLKIRKLMSLFPWFVRFPVLFRRLMLRRILFSLPVFMLRAAYEIMYTLKMARLYAVKVPVSQKCRIALRYFMNLW